MKKILLLVVWMVFTTALMAQQVFITEDEKVVASSIIEETPEGLLTEFVYQPQVTNGKKITGFINITAYDKKLHKTI
jgi:hypothetical protein